MAEPHGVPGGRATLSASSRRTLDALFAHPVACNLEWAQVMALFREVGSVESRPNDKTVILLGAAQEMLGRPHGKDMTLEEVMEIRDFLSGVGVSPQLSRAGGSP
jgi:hypothetical protein